jgi:hypothetical protein
MRVLLAFKRFYARLIAPAGTLWPDRVRARLGSSRADDCLGLKPAPDWPRSGRWLSITNAVWIEVLNPESSSRHAPR